MKKKLLYISATQYGYHTISINYCKFLSKYYDITFICIDENKEKLDFNIPNIKVFYHTPKGRIKKIFSFTKFIKNIETSDFFDNIFVVYYKFSIFLPFIIKNKNMILDIRTGDINKNKFLRKLFNKLITISSKFYAHTTIISSSLGKKLELKEFSLLPLGANPIKLKKDFSKEDIKIIYVGTLKKREIEKTIEGFYKYVEKNPNKNIIYKIIGGGNEEEKNKIINLINKLNLSKNVFYLGYVPYNELEQYYQNSDIGISFIPIKEYFQEQPPTKTFEYLLAGLPVIATKTNENKKVIHNDNGILIEDTVDNFSSALRNIVDNIEKGKFSKTDIQENAYKYSYSYIIENFLLNVLEKYANK